MDADDRETVNALISRIGIFQGARFPDPFIKKIIRHLEDESNPLRRDDAWKILCNFDPRLGKMPLGQVKKIWIPFAENYPDFLPSFLGALERGKGVPVILRFAALAVSGKQPDSYKACVEVLGYSRGAEAVETMQKLICEDALTEALYGREERPQILPLILLNEGASSWRFQIQGRGESKSWISAWAQMCGDSQHAVIRGVEVLDLLLGAGAELNTPSLKGAACEALEVICERALGEKTLPMACGTLIDALLDRGADWTGLMAPPGAVEHIRKNPVFRRSVLGQVAEADRKSLDPPALPRI